MGSLSRLSRIASLVHTSFFPREIRILCPTNFLVKTCLCMHVPSQARVHDTRISLPSMDDGCFHVQYCLSKEAYSLGNLVRNIVQRLLLLKSIFIVSMALIRTQEYPRTMRKRRIHFCFSGARDIKIPRGLGMSGLGLPGVYQIRLYRNVGARGKMIMVVGSLL